MSIALLSKWDITQEVIMNELINDILEEGTIRHVLESIISDSR